MKVGYIILNEFLHTKFSIPMFASQKSKKYNADRCRNPLRFCETAPIRATVSYSRIIPPAVCQCPRGWFQMEKPPVNSFLQYFCMLQCGSLEHDVFCEKKYLDFSNKPVFPPGHNGSTLKSGRVLNIHRCGAQETACCLMRNVHVAKLHS